MSFGLDMSAMPPGVVEELWKGRVAREVLTLQQAPAAQTRAARDVQALGPLRSLDGLGGVHMTVTADAYHYWGRRLGYACWSDAQFIREFKRDNASARVKSAGTKIQVGYQGYVASEAVKQKYPAKIILTRT